MERGALGVLLGVAVALAIVVGVVITWFGFFPAIGITSDVELEIVTTAGHTIWDSSERLVMVEVARGNDSAELLGFNLIFVLGDEKVRHFVDGDLDANSAGIYYVDLSNYSGELEEIMLAPVFVGGEEGKVSSRFKVNDKWGFKNVSEIENIVVPVSSGSSSGGGGGEGSSSTTRTPVVVDPVVCVENWSCSDWGSCVSGTKLRNCSDANSCLTVVDKPSLSEGCVVLTGNEIFVDNLLAEDCAENYSVENRDCNGSDGDAYDVPQDAVDVVEAGDVVYFREGTYYLTSPLFLINKFGLSENKIKISGFTGEKITIDGSNITPRSFTESNSLVFTKNSSFIDIENFLFRNTVSSDGSYGGCGIYAFRSRNLSIINNSFDDIKGTGIKLYGTSNSSVKYNEISNCSLGIVMSRYLSGTPPFSNATFNIIKNNLVYNNTLVPEHSDGIALSGGAFHNTVSDNVVFGNYDDGIDANGHSPGSSYTIIKNNIVFNNGDSGGEGDGNGIKVSTNTGGGHLIGNNIVFDNERDGYDQDKNPGFEQNYYYNNIAYNNHNGFFMDAPLLPQDEDAILYNNIAASSSYKDLRVSNYLAVNDSDYNFWEKGDFISGQENHSLSGDPMFNDSGLVVDVSFGDGWTIDEKLDYIRGQVRRKFSLQVGSSAIDAGVVIPGYHCTSAGDVGDCVTWYGNAPDMGVYESE